MSGAPTTEAPPTPKSPVFLVAAKDVPFLAPEAFHARVLELVQSDHRGVTLYGRPGDGQDVVLTAVLISRARGLTALRTAVPAGGSFPSIAKDHLAFHAFEREVHEQHGLVPHDHPWLKPIRLSGEHQEKFASYPFFKLHGKEIHEVGVGPIHAGVIEPGHFRFMCYGETVHHLEIALGYQHRGVEPLLLKRPPGLLAPLVESIAGDTAVANALAYSRAIEALAGHDLAPAADPIRGVALELERIAMHLVGLAGLATDVGFLPGSSTYGRLRTAVINASMRISGSRFGRGWIRPGGARFGMTKELVEQLASTLRAFERDQNGINDLMFSARTVRHRLAGTGTVTKEDAVKLGLLGLAARASGVDVDLRTHLPDRLTARLPIKTVVESSGDCWARARVRAREIDESLAWLLELLRTSGELEGSVAKLGPPRPGALVVSLVEGWRGEVVHCLETDAAGKLRHYKVQDPSLLNWLGLALSVRGNAISDFPICNKSFDLSYCGNDL